MTLRVAGLIAGCVLLAGVVPAAAQFPAGTAPPQQNAAPCMADFSRLRDETQKGSDALRAASARHANAKEACGLFNKFTASEGKLLKYVTENATWCGIPKEIITQIGDSHKKALQMRAKICEAANQPQLAPHVPTLSDALTPTPDSRNIKNGHGTFDTLTSVPLER